MTHIKTLLVGFAMSEQFSCADNKSPERTRRSGLLENAIALWRAERPLAYARDCYNYIEKIVVKVWISFFSFVYCYFDFLMRGICK